MLHRLNEVLNFMLAIALVIIIMGIGGAIYRLLAPCS